MTTTRTDAELAAALERLNWAAMDPNCSVTINHAQATILLAEHEALKARLAEVHDRALEEAAKESILPIGSGPDWSKAAFPEGATLAYKLAYAYAKGQNDQGQNIYERIRALKRTEGET